MSLDREYCYRRSYKMLLLRSKAAANSRSWVRADFYGKAVPKRRENRFLRLFSGFDFGSLWRPVR